MKKTKSIAPIAQYIFPPNNKPMDKKGYWIGIPA